MLKFEALKVAEKICDQVSHRDLDILFKDLGITQDRQGCTEEECMQQGIDYYYGWSRKERIANALSLENDEKVKKLLEVISNYYPEINEMLPKNKQNSIIAIEQKFANQNLQKRYEELIKAVNNKMPLSFFWLAGSIIECLLCVYCKKNNIKSNKDDIDGYITALKNNNKISEGSTIYTTLQHFRLFRNTIHPNNKNNDYINNKNLQSRKEDLDDVIKYFTNDNQSN